jgi:hypothetical protein
MDVRLANQIRLWQENDVYSVRSGIGGDWGSQCLDLEGDVAAMAVPRD